MKQHLKIFFTDGNTLEFALTPVTDSSNVGTYLEQLKIRQTC